MVKDTDFMEWLHGKAQQQQSSTNPYKGFNMKRFALIFSISSFSQSTQNEKN